MLETMRNQAQSWIAKFILGGIALSFALWGVGDYFMGSRVEFVASVDGKNIDSNEFNQIYERQLSNYRSILGKQFSKEAMEQYGVKNETIQTLINRRLLLDEANQFGLVAAEPVLVARVQGNKAFQSAGVFDPQRYHALTRNMGFSTTRDFETEERLNLMIDALQQAIAGSARVEDSEIRTKFDYEYEKRVIAAVAIDPAHLIDSINISDEQAKQWFEDHQQNYKSPLRVTLKAVVIDPKELAKDIQIDEADIEAAYDSMKTEISVPEKRSASHILVRIKQDDEAGKAEARAKIEAALARINAGEEFAAVAKDTSDDITADAGGELGFFTQGTMVPEFDQAVFSMAAGDVSDIIETSFGFHIIKLSEIQPATVKPLAEVRDQIVNKLSLAKARDEAYAISQNLDNALGMEDSLSSAAESVNLKVSSIGPISANEAIGDELLGSNSQLRVLAFSAMPGEAINITELNDSRFVALEAVERAEPEPLTFKDAASQVYIDARAHEADVQAKQKATELLAAAAGKNPDDIAQDSGEAKYLSKEVSRNGAGDESDWLTINIIDAAFHTGKGAWSQEPVKTSRGYAMVYVQDVLPADEADFEEQKESLRYEVMKSKGAVRFARWMATIRDQHDIEIYDKVLSRF
ncbi:MAG: peptidylprolyl isomerase [Zetaproteobacteria bacterium CG_4_9_14_3_um_filter_49_83]|nr:MAG: peptidylprolyl isomerase [Zetaproteobacteria bacterium CG1_02_49_23]PIQ32114.1 MAG: peptidylprolyl isomerase [Zetaproteobacteria bacterium CG17_big_fil_post_rev_8_21_14_2_50_50_13]PIV30087.1 MAG: peptidylprolyl isomerase [Zetaproteobacteria bacterium CG02_land_8_20_14_3_00_50_9]PIY54762.1 MAG: peptidylprolyl isomerase [Zetaproteobacteria bacterium CG_4_10_14_0_8_um_filter_49_80]PJA34325.1 MAG: peptidylprolyl isomerase [Zetaproteobacteria bacterium CG_4_9_14_3_um_filter_49_83]